MEDHADAISVAGRKGAFAMLAAMFGGKVAELVEAVTNPVYLPGTNVDEQYRVHVAESLTANPWARVIKVSDFTDNGVGLVYTGAKAVKSARKYAPLVPSWPNSSFVRTRRSRFRPRPGSSASLTPRRNGSQRSSRPQKGGDHFMAISISIVLVLAVVVWLLHRYAGLKANSSTKAR